MLLLFFVCHVILLTADITTDILAAREFFERGDLYWGISTLVPIFAPFLARILITIKSLTRCFHARPIKLFSWRIPGP